MASRSAVAAAPLAAVLGAVALAAATGFSQRSALPAWAETHFYGFFLDRYPLFGLALVYALARLAAAAFAPGPAGIARRMAGLLVGAVLVLGTGLHPTFGGVVLRTGFATGGIAFLQSLPMGAAFALGTAAASIVYGTALGIGTALSGAIPPHWSLRGLAGRALDTIGRFLALWFALAVLALARDAGLGPWPRQALDGRAFAVAAGLGLAAFLPHAILVGLRGRLRAPPVAGRP
ncbi:MULTISPECIES: hypothetical protein [Methylobacterium]|uniref:Uncharacterized protein n=1 Tax=Methylobacterium jeotgali TaxID=381630 RepID=A0ABQ4SVE3_9HYPH|nr:MULTISPECIES: hypothetical protein [Methylobacterium]PIU08789.1 MAG: hypothetical protein COT56_00260 [Methylobacterium sp. CG09_land_8_20_14_0_10_71_15]PIU11914.1 MAG: hypothetical protein COT28_17435 [Methylobacterium sp. CG08_land_8_20_14_0_20_71_15]GBU16095.1 hypothetical protein AwMethylo_03100 [Methylobacterium sp.]GJE07184.1 hypothetical protein AOPFMNJM_2509 [Methylobacterium jeotgali]